MAYRIISNCQSRNKKKVHFLVKEAFLLFASAFRETERAVPKKAEKPFSSEPLEN